MPARGIFFDVCICGVLSVCVPYAWRRSGAWLGAVVCDTQRNNHAKQSPSTRAIDSAYNLKQSSAAHEGRVENPMKDLLPIAILVLAIGLTLLLLIYNGFRIWKRPRRACRAAWILWIVFCLVGGWLVLERNLLARDRSHPVDRLSGPGRRVRMGRDPLDGFHLSGGILAELAGSLAGGPTAVDGPAAGPCDKEAKLGYIDGRRLELVS